MFRRLITLFVPFTVTLCCLLGYFNHNHDIVGAFWDRKLYNACIDGPAYYKTFEEMLEATDVIVDAEYTGFDSENDIYEFNTVQTLKGDAEEKISLSVNWDGNFYKVENGYNVYDIYSFEEGQRYVLCISRSHGFNYEKGYYRLKFPIYISEKSLSDSFAYEGYKIRDLSSMNIFQLNRYDLFKEYVKTVANRAESKPDFFLTSDLEKIANWSNTVARIKILERKEDSEYVFENGSVSDYSCEIITLYKGDITLKTVPLRLYDGSVEVGKEYIIASYSTSAIEDAIDFSVRLSARAALWETEKESEILAALESNT